MDLVRILVHASDMLRVLGGGNPVKNEGGLMGWDGMKQVAVSESLSI